jgi:hypothetical protein
MDPASKVAYVPNKSNGIDAIRLDDGEVLWSVKDSGHPLLATEDRLFAWASGKANEMTVFVLDTTKKGKRLRESKPVKFPDWVSTGVTYGRSFVSTARLQGDNLFLPWQARAWYAGGAAPTREIMEAARKSAEGVARISIEDGSVEMMDRARAAKVGAPSPNGIPGELRDLKQGDHTYAVVEEAGRPQRFPLQLKRLLKAKDRSGKVVWEREIKAPVHLLPLP